MATSTVLNIKYKDQNEKDMTVKIPYVDAESQEADVTALANGIITNKTLWVNQPTTKVSAEFVTTTKTDVDISD